jgi:hypothetical protein
MRQAIMGLLRDDKSMMRVMNLDPAATTPMALEGYFKTHATIWESKGLLSFNFC